MSDLTGLGNAAIGGAVTIGAVKVIGDTVSSHRPQRREVIRARPVIKGPSTVEQAPTSRLVQARAKIDRELERRESVLPYDPDKGKRIRLKEHHHINIQKARIPAHHAKRGAGMTRRKDR